VTRNRGLEQASGDIAVLMVQDAVPASSRWLAALVGPLLADEGVAGAFARQCAWPGASRLTAHYLSKWTAAQSDPRTAGPITRSMFDAMSPSQRHATCAFDNVCSCIRMTVWRRFPFRATPIAEDLEWAREVLLAGYRLAYVPEATVWHSHERSTRYELQRTYLVHQRLQTLFGLSTVPTVGALCRAVASSFPMHLRLAAGDRRPRRHALVRGAALAVALPLGQYLGARSAREGRELLRTQGI
jgi:rhamnosyltransferase